MRSIHPHKWHLCGWIERIPGKMTVWKLDYGRACGREMSAGYTLVAQTSVWMAGMEDWTPLRECASLWSELKDRPQHAE